MFEGCEEHLRTPNNFPQLDYRHRLGLGLGLGLSLNYCLIIYL